MFTGTRLRKLTAKLAAEFGGDLIELKSKIHTGPVAIWRLDGGKCLRVGVAVVVISSYDTGGADAESRRHYLFIEQVEEGFSPELGGLEARNDHPESRSRVMGPLKMAHIGLHHSSKSAWYGLGGGEVLSLRKIAETARAAISAMTSATA